MVCYDSNRHQKSMEGILEVGPRGQCPLGGLSHNPATGFTLPRQQWSLLNRFRTGQGHCGACRSKKYEYVVVCCVLQTLIYAPVWWDPNDVPQRRILIHSFIHSLKLQKQLTNCNWEQYSALLPSWTVVCLSFTLLLLLLLPGWPTMGLNLIYTQEEEVTVVTLNS